MLRRDIEAKFHDNIAGFERADFYAYGALDAADDYAYALLGNLKDKVLLDLGCGRGDHALRFARAGALVHAVDISSRMLEVTADRARTAGLAGRIITHQVAAEDLHRFFEEGTFDVVFGHSILHHLELPVARDEIYRVLKRGGYGVFLEPLNHNPAINLFRRLTPWRRTPTEKPLRFEDIFFFAEPFVQLTHREFYLVALVAFVFLPFRSRKLFQAALNTLMRLDSILLTRWPAFGRYAWVIVMKVIK
ncbi:MAG: class I SAM-dependent methyltransferase [Candidatus Bathyarchaeia archaeon]